MKENRKDIMPETEMTGLTETEGDFVVLQLMEDVLLTNQVLRGCIHTIADMNDLEKKMLIGFVHYVFARPIGMSKCSKTDADHILEAILDLLMTTAPELDYEETKNAIPTIYGLLSTNDNPATVHIKTSTAFFLQAMENGGLEISDDDNKLILLLQVVEPLQIEVLMFLNFVLEQYFLDWTTPSTMTEAKRHQARDIADLREMVREESERIRERL